MPRSSASFAAATMWSGVGRSGSPRPSAMTLSRVAASSIIRVRTPSSGRPTRLARRRRSGETSVRGAGVTVEPSGWTDGLPGVPIAELTLIDEVLAVEENVGDVAHRRDVGERIAVDHHDVGQLAGLDRAQPVGVAPELGA